MASTLASTEGSPAARLGRSARLATDLAAAKLTALQQHGRMPGQDLGPFRVRAVLGQQ
jgi:hypothetical protein